MLHADINMTRTFTANDQGILALFHSQSCQDSGVPLFNTSRHDEEMHRNQELTTAYQCSDKLPCSVYNVNLTSDFMSAVTLEHTRQPYLRVQLAIIAFDGRCSEAADRLDDFFSSLTDLLSRG